MGTFAGALAYLRLAAVAGVPSARIHEVLPALKKLDVEKRSDWLAQKAEPSSWEGRLSRALGEAGSAAARIDAISEAVHDADTLFASRSAWSGAALRLQVLGGVLIAAFSMIRLDTPSTVLSLLVTASGGIVIVWLGRRASRIERAQRAAIDTLVALLVPDAHKEPRRREPALRSRAASGGPVRRGRSRLDRPNSPV